MLDKGTAPMPLRLVVFTTPRLTIAYDRLLRRLAAHPDVDLCAVVVDTYAPRPRGTRLCRLRRGIARHGPGWLVHRVRLRVGALVERAARAVWEPAHPSAPPPSPERLGADTGVRVLRFADVAAAEALDAVRALEADLGAICGGRILPQALLSIPRRGTLNLHKHRVPAYRGGGPPGYWELLAGDRSLGLTVHYATAQVDAGPVVAEATVPIDRFDTLEDLSVKADVAGSELYFDTILRLAHAHDPGRPQTHEGAQALRGPDPVEVHRLARERRRRMRRGLARFRRPRAGRMRTALGLAKYLACLPLLRQRLRRLARAGRAPVLVLYYHTVANDGQSPMALPLETFAAQVELLRRTCDILSLDQAMEALRPDAPPRTRPGVVLTFDDGYAADLATSVPLLRYYGVPATWFLSVGHIASGEPFAHDRGLPDPPRPMSPAQARSLADQGFALDAHGVFHERLGGRPSDEVRRILDESRAALARLTGAAPRAFAFPGGLPGADVDRAALRAAREAYPVVCLASGAYNYPGATDGVWLRYPAPDNVLELAWLLDGFTRLREVLRGNAWGLREPADLERLS